MIQFGTITVPAAIGRTGRTVLKREGDGATPIAVDDGCFTASAAATDHAPSPRRLPIRRIRPDMLWCDQPAECNYNRLVKAPFRPSHEEMKRGDGLYDVCLVHGLESSPRGCETAARQSSSI